MSKTVNKDSSSYRKEYEDFIRDLNSFHQSRGTGFDRIPHIGGRQIDLYLLYRRVIELGGWQKVNTKQKWVDFLEDFRIPKACTNASQALKNIYIRFLDIYEKVHFLGQNPDKKPEEEDDAPTRKKACLSLYTVPLSYNYQQHDVPDAHRETYGMSCDLYSPQSYEKLEKALICGLPNEVDFAINICTLLSHDGKHVLRVDRSKLLMKLLLGHVGLFDDTSSCVEYLYEDGWNVGVKRNFIRFWLDTVHDVEIRALISRSRDIPEIDTMLGDEVLNLGRDKGIKDVEGQRVNQLAVIIRNLSFEEEIAKHLTSHSLVFRFLTLCLYCSYGNLRQLCLDTLGNLASHMKLKSVDSCETKLVLKILDKCLSSDDKFEVVRGLEILGKLCQEEVNEYFLCECIELKAYENLIRLLTVYDIQLIVYTLEAIYQLSELGETTTTKIASVKHSVEMLIRLLTIEAQSYGPNSLQGIKVVEYVPPKIPNPDDIKAGSSGANPSAVGESKVLFSCKSPATAPTPSTGNKRIPPASQPLPATSMPNVNDMEKSTLNWIQAAYETKDGTATTQTSLMVEFVDFCKKFNLPNNLTCEEIINSVVYVFPSVEVEPIDGSDGTKDVNLKGLCRRPMPLPFAIQRPVSKSPSLSSTSGSQRPYNCSPSVDLNQTPTLRKRLMEPPQVTFHAGFSNLLHTGAKQNLSAKYPPNQIQENMPAPNTPKGSPRGMQKKQSNSRSSFVQGQASIGFASPQPPGPVGQMGRSQFPGLPGGSRPESPVMKNVQQAGNSLPECTNVQVASAADPRSADITMIKSLLAKKLRHNATPSSQSPMSAPESPVMDTSINLPPSPASPALPGTHYNNIYPANVPAQGYLDPPMESYTGAQNNTSHPVPCSSPWPFQQSASKTKSIRDKKEGGKPSLIGKSPNRKKASSKRKSSPASPRPSSPRSSSPRTAKNFELEICGAVEKARDIVENGTEAKIERVENKRLLERLKISKNSVAEMSTVCESPMPSNIPSSLVTPPPSCTSENIIDNSASSSASLSLSLSSPLMLAESQNDTEQTSLTTQCNDVEKMLPHNICDEKLSSESTSEVLENFENSETHNVGFEQPSEEVDECSLKEPLSPVNVVQEVYEPEEDTNKCDDMPSEPSALYGGESLASDRLNGVSDINVDSIQFTAEVDNEEFQESLMLDDKQSVTCDNDTDDCNEIDLDKLVSGDDGNKIDLDKLVSSCRIGSDLPAPMDDEQLETQAAAAFLENELNAESQCLTNEIILEESGNYITPKLSNMSEDSQLDSLQKEYELCQETMNDVECDISGKLLNDQEVYTQDKSVVDSSGVLAVSSCDVQSTKDSLINESRCNLTNGGIKSPESLSDIIIPSPTSQSVASDLSDRTHKLCNGAADDSLDAFPKTPHDIEMMVNNVSKAVLKINKINGIIGHIGNGDHLNSSQDSSESSVSKKVSNTIKQCENDHKHLQNGHSEENVLGRKQEVVFHSVTINCPTNIKLSTVNALPLQVSHSGDGKAICLIASQTDSDSSFRKFNVPPICNVNIEKECEARHVPTPETSRDSELSCDSIASSHPDTTLADKHSKAFHSQGHVIKSKLDTSSAVSTKTFQKSEKSAKTTKPRKRNRSTASTASSSSVDSSNRLSVPPVSSPDLMCEWSGCKRCFESVKLVYLHVFNKHLRCLTEESLCKWEGCETMIRQKWSLVTHVQDAHCSEHALRAAAQKRYHTQHGAVGIKSAPSPAAMAYPPDAAMQAIRRFSVRPPFQEFMESREGPVTKHIRLTAALILRNLSRYSSLGRSLIKMHEQTISFSALSAVESSSALSNCLWEIMHDH